jgi:hypothetical protein
VNDNELRALVRESIAKQLSQPARTAASHAGSAPAMVDARLHASHAVYDIARIDADGPCIIEPSVPCTHCNYCKSHGH